MPPCSHLKQFLRCLTASLFAITAFASPAVFAQSGYFVVPLIAVEGVYDDNIFFDTDDASSDFIWRVSPQLDVGYESATLSWLLSYRNDAEWYQDFSELDSSTARGFGLGTIEYQPNRRWTFRGDTEYIETNSAQDLTLTPGGEIPGRVGRAEAERFLLGGRVDYRFSEQLTGGVDVSWIDDELINISTTETLRGALEFEQTLSPTRTILYSYLYRDYEFERVVDIGPSVVVRDSEDSHTPWLGITQALSATSRLEARAGPRFSDGETDPYFLFSWTRDYDRGDTVIEALWDETSVLAEVGKVESKSIYASWNHEFSADLEGSAGAGFARLEGTGYEADIAYFDLSGIYRFNRFIFMTASYRFNTQDIESITSITPGSIDRNAVSLAVTFTRPRRDS